MFRIQDKITGLFIKGSPYGTTVSDHDLSKTGKVFKRKGDLSNHITQNFDFYRVNVNRFEIVESEFVEVNRTSLNDAIQAKKDRDKVKAEEHRKYLAESKLREIERLRLELAKLTGKA